MGPALRCKPCPASISQSSNLGNHAREHRALHDDHRDTVLSSTAIWHPVSIMDFHSSTPARYRFKHDASRCQKSRDAHASAIALQP